MATTRFLILTLALLANGTQVEQVHVATGKTPGQVTVTWSSRSSCSESSLHIGGHAFLASTIQHTQGSNVQWISKAAANLTANTQYTYQLSCSGQLSSPFTLKTPPATGATTFIIYGDLTVSESYGEATLESFKLQHAKLNLSHIIHVGDIAYDLFTNDWKQGDSFMNALQPIISQVPFMTIPGNHEADDGYKSYDARFFMPQNNFYHSYTIGLVKYVAINTEAFFYSGSDINAMLASTKDALQRSAAELEEFPWLIVYGHRPFYCSSASKKKACDDEAKTLKSYFEDMFYQAGVDVYVNGHVHNYERTAPVYKSKVLTANFGPMFDYSKPKAPIYITDGGAGPDGGNSKIDWDAPDWFVVGEEDISYSIVTVYNSTHLWWEQWLSDDGLLADSFWIKK